MWRPMVMPRTEPTSGSEKPAAPFVPSQLIRPERPLDTYLRMADPKAGVYLLPRGRNPDRPLSTCSLRIQAGRRHRSTRASSLRWEQSGTGHNQCYGQRAIGLASKSTIPLGRTSRSASLAAASAALPVVRMRLNSLSALRFGRTIAQLSRALPI